MMDSSLSLGEQLLNTYRDALAKAVAAAPKVATGILMVIVALLFAAIVEKLLRSALTRMRFDGVLAKAGLDKMLQKIGVRQSLNLVLPRLAYYLLLLLFAQTGAEGLGLFAVANAISAFMAYLPNVIAAILLIMLGTAAGQFAGGAVAQSAKDAGIEYGASLGSLVSTLILFIVGIMALAQLKINTDIIRIVTMCSLSGLALAFGLSFGLGTRDITRNVIAGFYARKIFRAGDSIEVRGRKGILKAITPTQTLVGIGRETLAVSNAVYLEEIVVHTAADNPSSTPDPSE